MNKELVEDINQNVDASDVDPFAMPDEEHDDDQSSQPRDYKIEEFQGVDISKIKFRTAVCQAFDFLSEAGEYVTTTESLIPILPNENLNVRSELEAGSARFAHLFAKAWKRIPLSVRSELQWYWQNGQSGNEVDCENAPILIYTCLRDEMAMPKEMRWYICHNDWSGVVHYFYAPMFALMPGEVVMAAIADALSFIRQCMAIPALLGEDSKPTKIDPEEIQRWGFDKRAFDRWLDGFQEKFGPQFYPSWYE